MTKKLVFLSFLLYTTSALGQINMADSTAQVISYWEKGEKQNYAITHEKVKLTDSDTTSREFTTYDVEVTVLDQTDNTYTVEWLYKNINTSSTDPALQKLMNISKEMKVVFKTNELGVFLEVVNWQEVKEYILKASTALRKEFAHIPEMENILDQLEATYSTKTAIESASIKDIQQFHTFHGAQYKLGEFLEGKMKVPNIYGPEPFDSDFTVYLDEINEEENTFVMRATQEVDEEQLTTATLSYLTALADKMKVNPPKKEDINELKNETLTASRIHGNGWIIYSVQTMTVAAKNITNIEERIIEIK